MPLPHFVICVHAQLFYDNEVWDVLWLFDLALESVAIKRKRVHIHMHTCGFHYFVFLPLHLECSSVHALTYLTKLREGGYPWRSTCETARTTNTEARRCRTTYTQDTDMHKHNWVYSQCQHGCNQGWLLPQDADVDLVCLVDPPTQGSCLQSLDSWYGLWQCIYSSLGPALASVIVRRRWGHLAAVTSWSFLELPVHLECLNHANSKI